MINLYMTSSSGTNKKFLEVLKNVHKGGVVVITTKPYKSLESQMKAKGIDPSGTIFIDTVGKDSLKNVIISPIDNLTSLSITISETLNALGDRKKFIVFDSLTALTLYNSPETVSKFLIFIMNQFRQWNVDVYMIATEEGMDAKIMSVLKQNADKISQ